MTVAGHSARLTSTPPVQAGFLIQDGPHSTGFSIFTNLLDLEGKRYSPSVNPNGADLECSHNAPAKGKYQVEPIAKCHDIGPGT